MRQEQDEHISTLEMKAILNALIAFHDGMMGQDDILMLNNSSVVAYINKRATVSRSVCQLKRNLPVGRDALRQTLSEIHIREAECGG